MVEINLIKQDVRHLSDAVEFHGDTLFGKDRQGGMAAKVNLMWKVHIWLLCTGSSAVTLVATLLFQKIFGVHP